MSEAGGKKRPWETGESSTASKSKKSRKPQQEEYEVEKIVGQRYSKEKERTEYLVKWKDYPESENTWESKENLGGCQLLLDEYSALRGGKPIVSPSTTTSTSAFHHRSFKAEDDIDHQLIKDLGGELMAKKWDIRKLGAGKYEVVHRNRKCASPSPSTSSSTESETKDPNGNGSKKQFKKLQKWIADINEICKRAGEAQLFVENDVDGAIITTNDFTYVTSLIPGKGITIPTENIIGCSCKPKGCFRSKDCCAAQMSTEFAYMSTGLLRLQSGRPIYECNSKCACDQSCSNRVVQKGRTVELVIFRTNDNRGWGVKAKTSIPKHRFVTEYVGEVISKEDADARDNNNYMFNMDFDENPMYVVDARHHGNIARFINHSCDPNLGVFGVWIDHYDGNLPRLAFFAMRDIKAGEELSFNYFSNAQDSANSSMRSNDSDDETVSVSRKAKAKKSTKSKCRCGSNICRSHEF